MKILILVLAMILAPMTVHAADLITKSSPYSVAGTMDRLVAAVENAGATVFARVDHAAGAASIDAELNPNQMLVFGKPKIGTPILQADPRSGLDLPIRVVVFEDASGNTRLAYHDPREFADDYELSPDLEALKTMAGAVGKLTDAATQPFN